MKRRLFDSIAMGLYWLVLSAPTIAVILITTKFDPISDVLDSFFSGFDSVEDRHGRGLGGVLRLLLIALISYALTTLLGKLIGWNRRGRSGRPS